MSCNRRYQKSTLNAFTNTNQAIAVNDLVKFANYKSTGCSIDFDGGSSIRIDKPGLYHIIFNAFTVESGTGGNVIVQLMKNGVPVAGAIAEAQSGTTTGIENLMFSTIVEIPKSCDCIDNSAVFTILNSGVAAAFGNVNISIVKLC